MALRAGLLFIRMFLKCDIRPYIFIIFLNSLFCMNTINASTHRLRIIIFADSARQPLERSERRVSRSDVSSRISRQDRQQPVGLALGRAGSGRAISRCPSLLVDASKTKAL